MHGLLLSKNAYLCVLVICKKGSKQNEATIIILKFPIKNYQERNDKMWLKFSTWKLIVVYTDNHLVNLSSSKHVYFINLRASIYSQT